MANQSFGRTDWNAAELSGAVGLYQLDFLRLGDAAAFTLNTSFVFAPLFCYSCGTGFRQRTGIVGLRNRGCGPDNRTHVAGARRHPGRKRQPQTVDRDLWRDAGGWRLPDVVWQVRRAIPLLLLAYGFATIGIEFVLYSTIP